MSASTSSRDGRYGACLCYRAANATHPLLGRERDLAAISRALRDEQTPLLTLGGVATTVTMTGQVNDYAAPRLDLLLEKGVGETHETSERAHIPVKDLASLLNDVLAA